MRRAPSAVLAGIALLLALAGPSCRKQGAARPSAAPSAASDAAAAAIGPADPEKVKAAIAVEGAYSATDISLPAIRNQATGFEDEPPSGKIEKGSIVPCFGGYYAALPASASIDDVLIEARNDAYAFSYKPEFSANRDDDGKTLGYTGYFPFEDKFWSRSGPWELRALERGDELASYTTGDRAAFPVFYRDCEDDPFKVIQAGHAEPGAKYSYRFPYDGKTLVVLYLNDHEEYFSPILVLRPDSSSRDNTVGFTFGEDCLGATFYLTTYSEDALPAEESYLPLFNQIRVRE